MDLRLDLDLGFGTGILFWDCGELGVRVLGC